VIVLLAVILVAATSGTALLSPHSASVPPGLRTLPPGSAGAAQLAEAQSSLERGGGPAAALHGTPTASQPSAIAPSYSWSNLTSRLTMAPSPRIGAMTWDAADGYVLLFGGETNVDSTTVALLADTWTYLNGTWTNITANVVGSPPALVVPGMVYYPPGGSVILFGGEYNNQADSDATWSYHSGVWTNLTTSVGTPPSPRAVPSMTYDTTTGEIVLLGGAVPGGNGVNDTWVFNNTKWTNVTSLSHLAASTVLALIANDPADSGVLAQGAMSYSASGKQPFYPGTFLYSGGVWTNLTPTLAQHPPIVLAGAMNYVSPAEGILLTPGEVINVTGYEIPISGVTWQYLGGHWKNITQQAGPGPAPWVFPATAVDPDDLSVLSFGGEDIDGGTANNNMWALSAPPQLNLSAAPTRADVGTQVNFTSAVTLGLSPNRISWNFGDGLNSTSADPTHAYENAGVYGAVATATDFGGQIGAQSVGVLVAPPPTATIEVNPANPTAGNYAGLVALVSGGTGPYSYQWTLGDGTTASGPTVSHAYSTAQTYQVQLTVTDQWGQVATASLALTVAGSPGSGGGPNTGPASPTELALIVVIVVLALVAGAFGVLWARKPRTPSPTVPPGVGSSTAPGPSSPAHGVPPPPP
jgi:chitodextrinase